MAGEREAYEVVFGESAFSFRYIRLPSGEETLIIGDCPQCGSSRVPSPLSGGRVRCTSCGLIRTGNDQMDLHFAENKPDEHNAPDPFETAEQRPFVYLEPDPLETR